ncbi:hypothetical protein HRbin29_00305 [bacterium HR29]|jgi:hypothetical protein|nr:hypothetical protein HRbin29_00305 [bacterium HR29]
MRDDEAAREYREAFAAWMSQLERLHSVLLEGKPLAPPALKGLLNREARAKERYERARRRLLGIADEPHGDASSNPFP